ncbi:unnamed protein product [Mycena citricolor]|uniref:Uncharacterized protein n=1 Tax=Mycena citricolor TaxID=2018698 RepID=A0AAD2HQ00_9AGAR|nr:unnamed protein product [Mycena citricolor]CAK5278744.1 unnamed protein product [Mycena citricolor]
MFAMTVHKCRQSMSTGLVKTPVMTVFLRDGVFWFLAISLVSTTELILWRNGRASLAEVPIVPGTSLIAVIGARVILNIKSLATPNIDETLNQFELSTVGEHVGRVTFGSGGGRHRGSLSRDFDQTPWYLRTT